MRIAEIFESISGEVGTTIRQGEPCTFVRFFGCPVQCVYCDTQESWNITEDARPIHYTVKQIIKEVKCIGNQNIIITGGEPVIQKGFEDLLLAMWKDDWIKKIVIETSGIPPLFDSRNTQGRNFKIVWAVDYKLPSAKSSYPELNKFPYQYLKEHDLIKFLIFTEEDLKEAIDVCEQFNALFAYDCPKLVFAPGDKKLTKLILASAKQAGVEIIINVQIHKILNIA